MNPKTEADKVEGFRTVLDVGFKVVHDHGNMVAGKAIEHDVNLLLQTILLKGVSVFRLYRGEPYVNDLEKGATLARSIDPLSMTALVRSQFEAYCMLNHIYHVPSSEPERSFHYLLWVIAGLKERQRFAHLLTIPELVAKAAGERQEIDAKLQDLRANGFFAGLDAGNQQRVEEAVADRVDRLQMQNGTLVRIGWSAMFKRTVGPGLFDPFYSMLSMAAHTSNVAVFQFSDMYVTGHVNEAASFALECSRVLMAFAVRDYAALFPELDFILNGLKNEHQLFLHMLNVAFRGESAKLNDIMDHLGLKPANIPGYVRVSYP